MDHRAVVNRVRPPHPPRAKGPAGGSCASPVGKAGQIPLDPVLPPPGTTNITCEWAVFTSIRSPMGEGYRIVTATPGITPQDKAQITKRAPSHGALLSDDDRAIGLLAFPLPGKRYCVCASCYGGTEHTARGGRRVWTDVVILDERQFCSFGCNPIRVHGAVCAAAPEPNEKPSPVADRLNLAVWDNFGAESGRSVAADSDLLGNLVASFLCHGASVVHGPSISLQAVEVAIDMLPFSMRAEVSLTAGIAFSLTRRSTLALVGDDDSAERTVVGQDIRWCDLHLDCPAGASPFDDWITFVRHRAGERRLASLAWESARMSFEVSGEVLSRVAQLHGDIDLAGWAAEEERDALRTRYAAFAPQNPVETDLYDRLIELLQPAEVEAEPAET